VSLIKAVVLMLQRLRLRRMKVFGGVLIQDISSLVLLLKAVETPAIVISFDRLLI